MTINLRVCLEHENAEVEWDVITRSGQKHLRNRNDRETK